MSNTGLSHELGDAPTLHPRWSRFLRRFEDVCSLAGACATLAEYELLGKLPELTTLTTVVIYASLLLPFLAQLLQYGWSRARASFLEERRPDLLISLIWVAGMFILPVVARLGPSLSPTEDFSDLLLGWSQLMTLVRGGRWLYQAVHAAAAAGMNPALVLVMSFALLIGIGTLLLMSPRSRPAGADPAPFLKALFTATSASCVTGLTLDPPGSYWSRTGQLVILGLIQIGGLGIMTFGAFFAFVLRTKLHVREQMTFRELLESNRIGEVNVMIRSIITLTLGIELIGAVLLYTVWPDMAYPDRLFYAVFHSVSAFCNAGFCLRDNNLMGWEQKWQVWGVFPALIILGGFGFNALSNWQRVILYRCQRRNAFGIRATCPPRVTLTTRMVTWTTFSLLIGGTGMMYLLEYDNPAHPAAQSSQWANAWFHSVTLRTAGFNTIDHEQLRPATKLLGVVLMFIGASPGSTGGGVKTVMLALAILTLRSVLRGRPGVETGKRTIPQEQVFRGLAIMSIGLTTLMLSALLLVLIEDRPERVVDQLYEAASAFGTVGVSANLTPLLKPASHVVLIVTMFLGRVGPLTLIIALAGFRRPGAYAYPEERISLG